MRRAARRWRDWTLLERFARVSVDVDELLRRAEMDRDLAERLWTSSEKWTGVLFEG